MISSSKGAATGNGAGLAGSIGGSGPITAESGKASSANTTEVPARASMVCQNRSGRPRNCSTSRVASKVNSNDATAVARFWPLAPSCAALARPTAWATASRPTAIAGATGRFCGAPLSWQMRMTSDTVGLLMAAIVP